MNQAIKELEYCIVREHGKCKEISRHVYINKKRLSFGQIENCHLQISESESKIEEFEKAIEALRRQGNGICD